MTGCGKEKIGFEQSGRRVIRDSMNERRFLKKLFLLLFVLVLPPLTAEAEDSQEELAKKTLNPIASLISLPLQFNQDYGIGTADAKRSLLNIQPVIPFSLNAGWNLISRTIVPLIEAESPAPGGETKRGMGDITQSLFFSPGSA